jgi:putative ABC transport system permease protein
MFDLEQAIKKWKLGLATQQSLEDGTVAELESHLRDRVEELAGKGMSREEAFQHAAAALGGAEEAGSEFYKVYTTRRSGRPPWQPPRFVPALAWNYLKLAGRRIRRHKGFSFINIAGLAAGMACCLLILLYIAQETRYDRFHRKAERIYRVVLGSKPSAAPTNANGSMAIGPALKRDFPEIDEVVRLKKTGQGQRVFIGHQDRKFYEDKFFFASPEIFSVFDFPLLRGDPRSALRDPRAIVITEAMARKYFPGQDPMGKTLLVDAYNEGKLMPFSVTGIAADVPASSHVHFDFLAAYDAEAEDADNFGAIYQNYTYVLLGSRNEAAGLQSKLRAFLLRHWSAPWYDLYLQPLPDIRLHSHLRSEIEANGDVTYILVFSLIALFILAIACINYTNLATARAIRRAKEVSIRRAIGASRPQLIRQFLGEALTVSFISGWLAVALCLCVLPLFNRLAGKDLDAAALLQPAFGLAVLTLIVVLGLLSGLFPALFLSRLQPGNASNRPRSAGAVLRKGLVTFQFSLSIVTIAGALAAVRQLDFIKNKNLGFDREGLMVVTLNDAVRANYDAFRAEMLAAPGVRSLAASEYVPTRGSMHWNFQFEGNPDPVEQVVYRVDKDFFSTYNLRLIAGRPIQRAIASPSGNEFMISESSVRRIGYASAAAAIGKAVQIENVRGSIAGVVGDIHIYSLHQTPYATLYFIRPIKELKYLSLRLRPGNLPRTMRAIAATWRRMVPDYPLDFFFLDRDFLRLHEGDANVSRLIGIFSILCIVVACLGLFGLGTFTLEQRTKEIAVRRVLGAPLSGIVSRLCREFIPWVLLANVIAWPAAYVLMQRWLRDFAYRTRIPPGIFVLSGLLAFLIAWLTIIVPTWRAARANPVDSLRYE